MQHLQRMCSFFQKCNNIRNDLLSHQLYLQGLFVALNIRPCKHIVQCDQVKGSCNVTRV